MRGRMNDGKLFPSFQVGEPMDGGAIGEVVESKAGGLVPGDLVQHMAGWRAGRDPRANRQQLPTWARRPNASSGVLGVTGVTAYFGLLDGARAKGDVVFVSAAAGAVGSCPRSPRPRE